MRREFKCVRHNRLFVRPDRIFVGGVWRKSAQRCPVCVEEARETVRGLIEFNKHRDKRPFEQTPVVMVEGAE